MWTAKNRQKMIKIHEFSQCVSARRHPTNPALRGRNRRRSRVLRDPKEASEARGTPRMRCAGSDRPDFCAWVAVTKNVKTATRIDPQERSIGQFDPRKRSKTVNYGPPRGATGTVCYRVTFTPSFSG